jgi:hypothetical protein
VAALATVRGLGPVGLAGLKLSDLEVLRLELPDWKQPSIRHQ